MSSSATYSVTLDMWREAVLFPSGLLHAERRGRGSRGGLRALGCFAQAVLVLRWFIDGTRITELVDLYCKPFAVQVSLQVDGVDFIGPKHYIPIFDIMSSVLSVLSGMPVRGKRVIDFTETSKRISFEMRGNLCRLEVLNQQKAASVAVDELVHVMENFLDLALGEMMSRVPGMERNVHMGKFLAT